MADKPTRVGARLAPVLHRFIEMPPTRDGKPNSYDDIVRKTTIEPDTSVRPSRAQEQEARDGHRALDVDERVLHDRVMSAIAASSVGSSGLTVEVSRDLVTLRGRVPQAAMLRTLEDLVARVPGVETIHNQVVIG